MHDMQVRRVRYPQKQRRRRRGRTKTHHPVYLFTEVCMRSNYMFHLVLIVFFFFFFFFFGGALVIPQFLFLKQL